MGDVKLTSTGGGSVTLTPPSTASNYTVTLPAANATLADTSSTQTLTNKTLTAAGSNTVEATSGPTSTQLAGQRNKIINGNFGINQRGVSGTVTLSAGAYGHDRWKAGSGGCTYTFSTSGNVTTITISSGTLQQVIEGLNIETGSYVLSWSGTAQGRINSGSYGAFGAVTASLTGGSNQTIEFNAGTLSLAQLEKGATATPFEFRNYQHELMLCQRYYESFVYMTSNSSAVPAWFKVKKRASPTCSPESGSSFGLSYPDFVLVNAQGSTPNYWSGSANAEI